MTHRAPDPQPPAEWFASPIARGVAAAARSRLKRPEHRKAAVRAGLHSRSFSLRHVLLDGHDPTTTYSAFVAAARRSPRDLADQTAARSGPWIRDLACLVAQQLLIPEDLEHALALFEVADHVFSADRWTGNDQLTYAQTLWAAGEADRLGSVLGRLAHISQEDLTFLELDLESLRSSVGSPQWHALVDRQLGQYGIERVRVGASPSDAPAFDRLTTTGSIQTVDGPQITVIMSAYRPGPEIFTSVRSILKQTWVNLELLVVDDASGPEFAEVFDRIAALDDRVSILQQPVNRGTYVCRNVALDVAAGELVTFQDADDWSHPQRLDRQARPLLESRETHSTLSRSIRCSADLVFQRLGYTTSRKNASSLMFRRAEVVSQVGYFDSVRKGGDTEFIERIDAAMDGHRVLLDEQLAFVRMEDGSLSRADFMPGWTHPARLTYRQTYRTWHELIRQGASPRMPRDARPRPFPAPHRFLPERRVENSPLDVVVAADWRRYGPVQRAMVDEVRAMTDRGWRIGVLQLSSGEASISPHRPMCAPIRELIFSGLVEPTFLDDERNIRLLLVRQPTVMEFPPATVCRLELGSMVMVADGLPAEAGYDQAAYALEDCDRNARALFGVEATWAPNAPLVRFAMLPILGPTRLTADDLPGILAGEAFGVPRTRFRSDRPVIGRVSPYVDGSWPRHREDILAAYPDDESFDVRVLGGREILRTILGEIPARWLVYPASPADRRTFLSQLDFLVHVDGSVPLKAPSYDILEGLASGCVAVLPPRFRKFFGDAAIYCEPHEVPSLVSALYAAPDAFRAQSRRGLDFVRRNYGSDAFCSQVERLLSIGSGATIGR